MMQQMMAARQQQLFGGQAPGAAGGLGANAAGGANPMAAMMQQMMGGGGLGGGFPQAGGEPAAPQEVTPAMMPGLRTRFASQLQQLATMGFTEEEKSIKALFKHDGRTDAAIDTLLSGDL